MRKFTLSAVALFVAAGLGLAGEVTLVKYDDSKKELMVKDGDKEMTYKITDKTTFKQGDKDVTAEDAAKMLGRKKAPGMKFDVTGTGDAATEIKFKPKKAK